MWIFLVCLLFSRWLRQDAKCWRHGYLHHRTYFHGWSHDTDTLVISNNKQVIVIHWDCINFVVSSAQPQRNFNFSKLMHICNCWTVAETYVLLSCFRECGLLNLLSCFRECGLLNRSVQSYMNMRLIITWCVLYAIPSHCANDRFKTYFYQFIQVL